MIMSMDFSKFEVVFKSKIKGKRLPGKSRHDGNLGHWIEKKFGVKSNAIPGADLDGYEIKSGGQKGSFGDWMAGWYIWYDWEGKNKKNREKFLKIFGTNKKPADPSRFSWTGTNYGQRVSNEFTSCGQRMQVTATKDLIIQYSYAHDLRANKSTIVPSNFHNGIHCIAKWSRDRLSTFVTDKFGQKGWVMFQVGSVYGVKGIQALYLGKPFTYAYWIGQMEQGNIIFDSGMSTGGSRNRSQFRANKQWWKDNAFKVVN